MENLLIILYVVLAAVISIIGILWVSYEDTGKITVGDIAIALLLGTFLGWVAVPSIIISGVLIWLGDLVWPKIVSTMGVILNTVIFKKKSEVIDDEL